MIGYAPSVKELYGSAGYDNKKEIIEDTHYAHFFRSTQNNIMCLSTIKAYAIEISSFLVERQKMHWSLPEKTLKTDILQLQKMCTTLIISFKYCHQEKLTEVIPSCKDWKM